METKQQDTSIKRYECTKCKAHILGELSTCSVCGEMRNPLIPPLEAKFLHQARMTDQDIEVVI